MSAVTTGRAAKRFNRKGAYHIAKWVSPSDSASWKIKIDQPGRFAVNLSYAARPESAGGRFEAVIGSQTLRSVVQPTHDWFEYRTAYLGQVELDRSGEYTVTIRPSVELEHNLMYFRALDLTPVPLSAKPKQLAHGASFVQH